MKAVKRKCFEMPIVHWKVKAQESVQSSRGGRGQREVSREEEVSRGVKCKWAAQSAPTECTK